MADDERRRAVRAVQRAGPEVAADVARDLVEGLELEPRVKLIFALVDGLPPADRFELSKRLQSQIAEEGRSFLRIGAGERPPGPWRCSRCDWSGDQPAPVNACMRCGHPAVPIGRPVATCEERGCEERVMGPGSRRCALHASADVEDDDAP